MKNNYLKLLIFIAICEFVGIAGTPFTINSISTWYVYLIKLSFSPPNWIFGPVWTLLYLLMGISWFLVVQSKSTKKLNDGALKYFYIQLILNFFWTIIFFGLRSPILAFVEIVSLWIFILLTIKSFYKINKNSSYLLIPYLIWVSFASVLNLSIVVLN